MSRVRRLTRDCTEWLRGAVVAVGALALLGATPWAAEAFCFDEAAQLYDLPPLLLRTIAEHESGLDPNAAGWNKNGSVDVGLMQINSWWEDRLGEARWIAVCTDPCYNVKVGAWILADCIARHGYTAKGIGCYNAVSPGKRERYTDTIVKALLGKLWQADAGVEDPKNLP